MKRILLIVLAFFPLFIYSQERLSFSKVIQADSIDKTNIYLGVKEWFGLNFVSAKSVIDVDDKDAGLIIGSGNTQFSKSFVYACYSGWLYYTIKVQCRDGRYKVDITNFRHEIKRGNSSGCELGLLTTAEKYNQGGTQKGANNKVWKELQVKAKDLADTFFDKFDNLDFSNIGEGNDSDW